MSWAMTHARASKVGHEARGPARPQESAASRSILVVSRERREAIPMLEQLLNDASILIVVDRRVADRRGSGRSQDAAARPERRTAERRRQVFLYLV